MAFEKFNNQRDITHTVSFGKRTQKTAVRPKGGNAFTTYGYSPDQGDIPLEYLVRISSFRHKCTIIGALQEDVTTSVESQWDYIVDPGKLAQGNYWVQAATGSASLITRATTRRMWQATTPMTLALKLKFEAVTNADRDVVSAIRMLQKIACPSEPVDFRSAGANPTVRESFKEGGVSGIINRLPVLSPPGPTPFTTKGILKAANTDTHYEGVTSESLRGGDLIMVEIGRLLTFHNVVATRVDGTHEIKFDDNGDCISGSATFTFQTYEMMTAEALDVAYEKHTPKKIGG